MQGRRHQVRRRFLGQLDDVLAQVGLEHVNALLFQNVVQAQLLGDHRLALGDRSDALLAGNLGHDGVGLRRVPREMHLPAGGPHVALQHRQVVVKVGDGVLLDAASLLPPVLPHILGHFGNRFPARAVEPAAGAAQRLPQLLIPHRRLRRRHEFAGCHLRHRSALAAVQDLRDVLDRNGQILPADCSADVHQAPHVAGGYGIGAALPD